MFNTLVINVDELWLKGKNRPLYYRAIKKHIKKVISKNFDAEFEVENRSQRLVASSEVVFPDIVLERLLKVPGIHSIAPAISVLSDMDEIEKASIQVMKEFEGQNKTFKVATKRGDKRFERNSMEVSREIGHKMLNHFSNLKVDVHKPEVMLEIKILHQGAYVSSRKYLGVGGLPVGTSGSLICLLSGGFDSPVASYLMSKRGCQQDFIFFHSYPYVGDEVKEKIIDLYKVLAEYQSESRLFVVPFGDIQALIAKNCREEYRTILFRYYMVSCASLQAKRSRAYALLTGDSLGQVSSQTIGNITVMDNIATYPLFRPLLGFNKVEIIDLSRKVGTHDLSVIPHDDACSLFAPKHPVIKPDKLYMKRFTEENTFLVEIEKALDEAEIITN